MAQPRVSEMRVIPRSALLDIKWFDGKNGVEVAGWLVGYGVRPSVQFHQYGEKLSIEGQTKGVPAGEDGVWIDEKGELHTAKEIEEDWQVYPR